MEAASDKPSVHTAHTQTGHLEALANLCRLCGKRAQSVKEKKKNVSHDASKLRVLIFEVFGVDVSGDQAELHPTLCCTQCYAKTEELTQSPDIRSKALSVKTKFTALFKMYSVVHRQISHTRPINDEDLGDIQVYIDEYLAYYRGIFPDVRIIIKQHLLEDHVVPWIRRWGFGMGLHGEQGGESIHAQFNEISANNRGTVCPLKRTPLGTTRSPYLSITNYSRKTAQDKNTKVEKK